MFLHSDSCYEILEFLSFVYWEILQELAWPGIFLSELVFVSRPGPAPEACLFGCVSSRGRSPQPLDLLDLCQISIPALSSKFHVSGPGASKLLIIDMISSPGSYKSLAFDMVGNDLNCMLFHCFHKVSKILEHISMEPASPPPRGPRAKREALGGGGGAPPPP